MLRLAMALSVAGLLVGCARGPLNLRVEVHGQSAEYGYQVKPDGQLRVVSGLLLVGGDEQVLYQAQLDKPAMQRLAKAVSGSRFLLDTRRQVGEGQETSMAVHASLGLLENEMTICSAYVASVGKVIDALNAELPARVRIPYRSDQFRNQREPDVFEGLPPTNWGGNLRKPLNPME